MKIIFSKEKLISANVIVAKARWFYYAVIIFTGIFSKVIPGTLKGNANLSVKFMLIVGGTVLILNCLYTYFFNNAHKYSNGKIKFVSVFQLLLDSVFATIVIYKAGGIISVGFIYYVFVIASSGFLFSFLGVLLITLYNSALYGGLIYLQYFNILPYQSRYGSDFEYLLSQNLNGVFTNVFTILGSMAMIGVFISLMSKSIMEKEEEVEIERNKEEAILDNLADGLIFIEAGGKIAMANPMAAKIVGFDIKDVVGKSIKKLNYSKLRNLKEILNVSTGLSSEIIPTGKPDQTLKVTSFVVTDKLNNEIGTARLIHDKSREKFVDKMKSEFITIAGHQLRTPLSAIKGAVHMIKSGDMGEVNEEQKKILGHTYEYTENLINIVNDLLNVSSIEEGKFDYKFEKIDFHNLIFSVTERFADIAEQKRISFNVKILNNTEKIELDIEKIKLAIGALVNNAITYTAEGGKVTVVVGFENNKLSVSVEDTGIGIPEHLYEKVFTKFFRSENALKFNTEGNGLDLFVAKNIIDNHQGRIWFTSEFNQGSTFYIELPLTQK